jgi:thiamine biosynthesis protein ThiS
VDIKVNGKRVSIDINSKSISIAYLFEHLKVKSATVVIEKNGIIIEKRDYDAEQVTDGDVVEIVQFVGGG